MWWGKLKVISGSLANSDSEIGKGGKNEGRDKKSSRVFSM